VTDSSGVARESLLRPKALGASNLVPQCQALVRSQTRDVPARATDGELPANGEAALKVISGSRRELQKQRSRFGDGNDVRRATQNARPARLARLGKDAKSPSNAADRSASGEAR
jgi:hypothetical protein